MIFRIDPVLSLKEAGLFSIYQGYPAVNPAASYASRGSSTFSCDIARSVSRKQCLGQRVG